MRLFSASLLCWTLFSTTLISFASAQNCPKGVVERREWRTLSHADQKRYINAVKKLKQQGTYDKLVFVHHKSSAQMHSTANFLPWHRLYLFVFESLLRAIDPAVSVPYWNWQLDSQAPELADIWSDDPEVGFGRNGDPTDGFCVRTGAFANWQPTTPTPHCLRRQWTELDRIEAFYSTDNLQRLMVTSKNYLAFAPGIERVPHGHVHVAIGGESGDMSMMYSPNDPVFWLHHSNLDKIWYDWQVLHNRPMDYGGKTFDGKDATLHDFLVGFRAKDRKTGATGPIKVGQVMRLPNLCVRYVEMDLNNVNGALPPATFGAGRLWRRQVQEGVTVKENVLVPPSPHFCTRISLSLLLHPGNIPQAWIEMNRLNKQEVLSDQSAMKDTIDKANAIPDYVSVSSTWNQPWVMKKLVKQLDTVVVNIQSKEVRAKVPKGNDEAQIVADLMALIRNALKATHIQKNPELIAADVKSVLGEPMPGLTGINNGWQPRHS